MSLTPGNAMVAPISFPMSLGVLPTTANGPSLKTKRSERGVEVAADKTRNDTRDATELLNPRAGASLSIQGLTRMRS